MGLSHSPSIVRGGLVLCLDAANPKSYPGSGTTWYDLSGNGNHSTLTNGPTYNSDNKGSIVFDGSDDYSVINISSSLQTSSPLTLSCWVYRNNTNGGMIFSAGGYYGLFAGGTFWYWNGNPNWVYYSCPVSIPSNTWFYYCLTFSGIAAPIYYINGVGYNASGTFYAPNPFGSSTLFVGDYSVYRPYSPFLGKISHYSFYNRVLSAAEIAQNFAAHRGRYGI